MGRTILTENYYVLDVDTILYMSYDISTISSGIGDYIMSRTRLSDRILPNYSKGEEIFNMVTHIVGGAFGILACVLCVVFSAVHHNPWAVVGSSIYGASMIILYTMSSIYHGLRPGIAKKVMQILDHCTIYLLIAGTYTPILLAGIRPAHPVLAWVLFGLIWGISAVAVTLNAIDLKSFKVFSMVCYISLGWMIIVALKATLEAVTVPGMWFLFLGGVSYTIGAVLYNVGKKKKFMHSVFHIFVVLGSLLQFFTILLYVV